jgi:hypothetical protein
VCVELLEKASEKNIWALLDHYHFTNKMENPEPDSFMVTPESSSMVREHVENLKQENRNEEWRYSELAREQTIELWDVDK